jgi:hypothetical protein
LSKS